MPRVGVARSRRVGTLVIAVAALAVLGVVVALSYRSGPSRPVPGGPPAGLVSELTHALRTQNDITITPLASAPSSAIGPSAAVAAARSGPLASNHGRDYAVLVRFTDHSVGKEVHGKVPNPTWVDVLAYVVAEPNVHVPLLGSIGGTQTADAVTFVSARSGALLESMNLAHPLPALH